jgi:hypothetical protein
VEFQDVEVNERVELKGCHIRKQAVFRDITTSSKLEFNGTTFDQDARFAGQFKEPVEFLRCDFRSGILFRDSSFRNGLKLKEISVDEDIYVHNCEIRRKLEFNGSVPKRRIFISETDVNDIGLRFDTSTPTLALFHGSTIHDGVLHQPEETETYYDLTNSTLGDVHIRPEYDICNYHFNETKYDGFRFYHHRNQFQKEGWQIHKFRPPLDEEYFVDHTNLASSITPPPVPRYEANMKLKDKSETYLLARKAAARQGDNISASKLHIVEMKSKKERYKHSVLFSNGNSYLRRGKDSIRYIKNQFHRITSVYGESPFRIVWLSAVGIIIWAGVIAYVGGVTDGSSIVSVETMLESEEVSIWEVMRKNIHMSVASFTTLGSSSYRPATSAAGFATMFAAFVGPFMIGLFVFTLGRQIRR